MGRQRFREGGKMEFPGILKRVKKGDRVGKRNGKFSWKLGSRRNGVGLDQRRKEPRFGGLSQFPEKFKGKKPEMEGVYGGYFTKGYRK